MYGLFSVVDRASASHEQRGYESGDTCCICETTVGAHISHLIPLGIALDDGTCVTGYRSRRKSPAARDRGALPAR
ncbi:MAG TPA: hypothetical protein HA256_01405 [Methanoregulaceae archaeon]|nr:hypothetical protein [Methanoregulaceae archaeon]